MSAYPIALFDGCEASTFEAVEEAIGVLRDLGAVVGDCKLPHAPDVPLLARIILRAKAAAYMPVASTDARSCSATTVGMLQTGSLVSAVHYLQAQAVWACLIVTSEKPRRIFSRSNHSRSAIMRAARAAPLVATGLNAGRLLNAATMASAIA